MNERIKWIDCAKGFAMFSVVICHVAHGFYSAGLFENHKAFLFAIENIADMFQMSLFTMASGYIFGKAYLQKEDNGKRVNAQVLNLCLLYVIWEVLLWLTKYIMAGQVNDAVNFVDLLLIIVTPIGPFWYLWMLIGFYLFFNIKLIRNISPKILVPILVLLALIGSFMRESDIWGNLHLFYASFFYFGILMSKTEKRPKARWYFLILLVTIVFIVPLWSYETRIFDIPVCSYVVAFGLTFCFLRAMEKLREIKVINFIGEHSIEVYTMHVFITSGGRVLIKALNITNVYFAVLLLLVLGIMLPFGIAYLMRKVKLYDFFFKPYKAIERVKSKKGNNKVQV